jgi:hypothetical protein
MSYHTHVTPSEAPELLALEESYESLLSELLRHVDELRVNLAALERRVVNLEQSAGRGLRHPSDLLGPTA